ncbi:MAG: PDZ domain-containing protein [Polyangiaceae bacterium]|nr:PDZ domain-containing protein [Polyangiaceae bacterium]
MRSRVRAHVLALVTAVSSFGLAGCSPLYPELSTKFSEAPKSGAYDPPPPPDRYYLSVKGGRVPPKARDGREWDQVFGSLPDPIAKVLVNEKELFSTNADSDTLEPKWEKAPRGNFAISAGDKIQVQLWNANTLSDTPIGIRELTLTPDMITTGEVVFEISGGGEVTLAIEPARPIWGAGFWFDLRNDGAAISRVVDSSPATRLGIRAGDRILKIDGKPTDGMSLNEIRSTLASIPTAGRKLSVQHDDGATLEVTLKEGPIYPLYKDYEKLPLLP